MSLCPPGADSDVSGAEGFLVSEAASAVLKAGLRGEALEPGALSVEVQAGGRAEAPDRVPVSGDLAAGGGSGDSGVLCSWKRRVASPG